MENSPFNGLPSDPRAMPVCGISGGTVVGAEAAMGLRREDARRAFCASNGTDVAAPKRAAAANIRKIDRVGFMGNGFPLHVVWRGCADVVIKNGGQIAPTSFGEAFGAALGEKCLPWGDLQARFASGRPKT